ncbi:MAG: methyltransferase domain-containing protein [Pseudomonadales bacterium]
MKLLACPICQQPLILQARTLACGANHCFDLSRHGYVNLLPVQNRRSKAPGDNQDMVRARSRFLDAGHYQPLSLALSTVIGSRDRRGSLVDLGCGEGYFTAAIASCARETYGVDVSKMAIGAASRRPEPVCWVVASSTRLPLVDAAFDIATAIMAPIGSDVGDKLKPGGALIRVSAGPDHLREFKTRVYADIRPHRRMSTRLAGFQHLEAVDIRFSMCLNRQARSDLLGMTPMAYRTARARIAREPEIDELSVSGQFLIDLFEKVS